MTEAEFDYDVFISYSHRDQKWVEDWLLPRLGKADLRVCIDFDCFELGAPVLTEIERAVQTSRKTLIVLTPDYLDSAWGELENILVSTLDPAARQRRLLPLMLEPCDLPLRIRALIYLDFTDPRSREGELKRLLAALGAKIDAALDLDDLPLDTIPDPIGKQQKSSEPDPSQPTAIPEKTEELPDEKRSHLENLLAIHERNRRILEEQVASMGAFAPPYMRTQLEDEKAAISRIEQQLRDT